MSRPALQLRLAASALIILGAGALAGSGRAADAKKKPSSVDAGVQRADAGDDREVVENLELLRELELLQDLDLVAPQKDAGALDDEFER